MCLNLSSLQILAVNVDNASLNDTQGQVLAGMANSFELENCVHCFNHTLQLSAKTLLHPFNVGLGKTTEDGDNNDVEDLPNETVMAKMTTMKMMKTMASPLFLRLMASMMASMSSRNWRWMNVRTF